ncbi:Hypothetical predicted protein [Pelobates cultripes]|uniref:A-kinase interacting protein 1 n=2 Tax=Pelobates cultripes TaxID=61616 RepID=A0AAD1WVR4_PELCU|nr:Hypothetical predicted protein [Pelobates cultripes]
MEKKYKWMEYSLKQTAELGLEVLERAKRREVNWSVSCKHGRQMCQEQMSPEQDKPLDERECLEEAFSAMAKFMRHTTEQCERYHNCVPASDMRTQEIKHKCRFHSPKPMHRDLNLVSKQNLAAGTPQSVRRHMTPRDVNIEVAPGTYRISGGSYDSERQTHIVNIPPGHSVDLTFNF